MCDENDEVVLSTSKGTIIRQKVKDITIQSRAATGVLIQSIQKDDSIIMVPNHTILHFEEQRKPCYIHTITLADKS